MIPAAAKGGGARHAVFDSHGSRCHKQVRPQLAYLIRQICNALFCGAIIVFRELHACVFECIAYEVKVQGQSHQPPNHRPWLLNVYVATLIVFVYPASDPLSQIDSLELTSMRLVCFQPVHGSLYCSTEQCGLRFHKVDSSASDSSC